MHTADNPSSNLRRLVLCFDGTGNKFQGNVSDTNIVKLFQMLDRGDPNQFHYYQPGIGTYSEKEKSKPEGFLAKFMSNVSTVVDQAVGTSFVDHLVAGYRFLMRYYLPHDAIYIFGFSRGAYTARFLAEMVHTIGLLSQGNEEMIQFAWDTFAEFQKFRGDDAKSEKIREHEAFMVKFKQTFCRQGVNVHFLGLFDCVNSVGQFEIPLHQQSFTYIPRSSASHVRHAVSIHERRLKFKPALFKMDNKSLSNDTIEMWFAGGHGDVGGGWNLEEDQPYLLSDTPLLWMLGEIEKLPHTENRLKFQGNAIEKVPVNRSALSGLQLKHCNQRRVNSTLEPHDMLTFGKGATWLQVIFWWIFELLPIFNRLELEDGRWIPQHWPPNLGASRDIPDGADIHPSVYNLHRAGVLKDNQLPKTGGNNPHISAPRVSFAWSKASRAGKSMDKKVEENGDISNGFMQRLKIPFSKFNREERDVSLILSTALANGTARV